MNTVATIIALIALVLMILVGIHFINGGIVLLQNRKWQLTRNMSPFDFEGNASRIAGAFFLVIAIAFFVCTIPILVYLKPLIAR